MSEANEALHVGEHACTLRVSLRRRAWGVGMGEWRNVDTPPRSVGEQARALGRGQREHGVHEDVDRSVLTYRCGQCAETQAMCGDRRAWDVVEQVGQGGGGGAEQQGGPLLTPTCPTEGGPADMLARGAMSTKLISK